MISVRSLTKSYAGRISLENLTLQIEAGSIVALLGPNGSGKTTLIKCILDLVFADKRSQSAIEITGVASIGYMPQTPSYPANLTCRQIVALLENLQAADATRKERLIADLGIGEFFDKKFSALSQGMKQKLNLLQCFMAKHSLYILDEPTAAVDPLVSLYVRNLIRELHARGATFIFTTHIIAEVRQIATRVIVLGEGKIITDKVLADSTETNEEFETALLHSMH